ncbi:MAG: Acyl-CoA dehydrogenase type 2 domain protein [Ramlibacter sp.]|nr:Acyl-CoA dehydrogenase type 2 domain protein [Ramlibacter sp.]MDB5915694.1 Acyl-CoA dehydrogenase type 2 domain protein [Ramlibacter sp.]
MDLQNAADGTFSAPGRRTSVPGAPGMGELRSAARDLVPLLRQRARQTEEDRRVSDEVTALFRQAGFFRLMQPARYGGYEYGFTAFLDVISELGRGCTSSSWSCSLGAIHQWLIGTFPEQAQDDVWRDDPDAIACVSYAPVTMAEAADGGWRVKGKWKFASNVDNSQWAVLGVQFPPAEKGQPPAAGFVLVPRSEWTIEDDWFMAGQAGTGSKTVVIAESVFVPAHRKLMFAEASSNAPPGASVNTNPLYRIPFLSAVPVCLVAPLIGTAQGAVEAFIELCGTRTTRGAIAGGGNQLSQFFPVQSRLGEAAACVDAARLLIDRDTTEVEQMAQRGEVITVDKRIRNRRDHAFAARLSQTAVEAVFASVGGAGLALDQPIQRMWRDANAIVRHISLNWDAVSSMTGQHLLGLEPKGQY